MALTGAVRKGGLLRGKVPQGETSPLKPCVKGLRSGPEFKKTLAMTLGIALFFDHGVRHDLARRWRQGCALPRRIVLSCAHSAAAGRAVGPVR